MSLQSFIKKLIMWYIIFKNTVFFAAPQYFLIVLKASDYKALHFTLDETNKYNALPALLRGLLKGNFQHFEYQQPDEYSLSEQLALFCNILKRKNITFNCVHSFYFYTK